MLCIKLHTSAFATRREAIRWWFHISLLHRFFKTIFIPSCYCCCCFWKKCIWIEGFKVFLQRRYILSTVLVIWDYKRLNETVIIKQTLLPWVQIMVVVAVHLAINFIHKSKHQQKNTKHEYSKKSLAGSTN